MELLGVHLDSIQASLGVFILLLLQRILIYPLFFSPLRKLPQAKVSWYQRLIGWIYIEPNAVELLNAYEDVASNVGLLCYPGGGSLQRVLVVDPEALRQMTTTEYYASFRKPRRLVELLGFTSGYGLLTSDGQHHKGMKRKILNAFTVPRIKSVSPLFWTKAKQLADNIESSINGKQATDADKNTPVELNIAMDISLATLDVIGQAALGIHFEALKSPNSDFMQEFRGMFPHSKFEVFLLSVGFYFPIDILSRLPFRRYRDFKVFTASLRSRCRKVIAQKKGNLDLEANPDMLGVMMSLDIFTDDELVEQMLTLLMAGHDATGTMIVWTLLELASHQKVQAELRKELQESLADPEVPDVVTNDMLEKLPYLGAVVQESMRLHPTAPKMPRETTKNVVLNGHSIPKGTELLMAPLVCNLAAESWGTDARNFVPDRWLSESAKKADNTTRPPFSNMTFNAGPRHCIGQRFAESEIRAVIACLILRFELESAMGDYDVYFGMTMRPIGGLKLRLKPLLNR